MVAQADGTEPDVTEGPSGTRFGPSRLYQDAGSMAISSIASAVLGAGFWALAAKLFPPDKLGVMTAVMAVITSTGVVIAAGIGDAYTALLPAVGNARARIFRRGQRLFWVIAAIGGMGGAVATVTMLAEVRGSIGVALVVVVGVMTWSAVNVQSSTLVALGRAKWLPVANTVIGVVKLGLLPMLALTLHWHEVELAFVIANTGLVAVLRPRISRVMKSSDDLPPPRMTEESASRMFNGFFAQSIASSGLNFGVMTLSPFLVTAFAGPAEGALFALAISVVQVLDLVSMAMALSLVVHAASDPASDWSMARSVFARALLFTSIGAVILVVSAPIALQWLNPVYRQLGAPIVIAILCSVCVVRTVYTVWSGLQRARRRIMVPLRLNVAFAILVPLLMMRACAYGAVGGAFALLLAQVALSGAAGIHMIMDRTRPGGGSRG